MTLVSSINIAHQALLVSQAAITAVSNNISNVDTEGYSKLDVNLASVVNYSYFAGSPIATANALSGVELIGVQRASNAYLQNYYWQENSTYSYLDKYTNVASSVENSMNELKNDGLSSAMTSFYKAASDLNSDPSDITARQSYISAADNVCSVFNNIATDLTNLSQSLVGDPNSVNSLSSSEISSNVDNVNNFLDQIAKVNYNIIKTNSSGNTSSALLDQRDTLISSLSLLMPLTVTTSSSGAVNISLGEHALLKGSIVSNYLEVKTGDATTPAIVNLVGKTGNLVASNVNSEITAGKIGAILDVCGSDITKFTISGVLDSLNTLASEFADVLNNSQTGDPAGDGTTGMCIDGASKTLIAATENIFVANGGGTITAANISINPTVTNDPYLIAAARVDLTTGVDYSNAIGNNSNMTLVLDSSNTDYAALNNTTIGDYLSNTVSKVGTDVKNLNNNFTSQDAVLKEIKAQLSSATGVNLDEELVNLMKYQRAYQAAARVFSVCSDLIADLINLGK
ncbi:MAG: flagellar hook-associated protein FlgK [bacterium]